MKTFIAISVLMLPLLLFTASTPKTAEFTGNAVDLKTNRFYYSETYKELVDHGRHMLTQIEYRNDKNEIIAEKVLNLDKSLIKPSFELKDLRDGYIEGAYVSGNTIKLFHKKNAKSNLESKTLIIPEPAVVDGGFNYFIKERWGSVMSGSTVTFNFAVPARLDYYSFRLRKVKEVTFNNHAAVILKMEPDNMIIRALVDPIILTYDIETERLMKYEGLSNINSESGKNYIVKITYPTIGP